MPADYTLDPHNANKGTVRGVGMVERSLQQYGAGRSILASSDGVILAGNKTYERAQELGIPVQEIESDGTTLYVIKRTDLPYDDPRAKELAIADNRASETGLEWDADVLQAFLDDGLDLEQFWFPEELEAVLAGDDAPVPGQTDPDEVPEPPADPITKPGDLWLLGEHRLLCGDSTVVTDVNRLMDGRKADMVFTDPPYNVGYDYATYDDTKTQAEYIQFLRDAIPMDTKAIVNNGNTKILEMIEAFGKPYHVGIWLKTNAMSPSAISSFSVWEPVFFYGKFKRRPGNDLFDYPISNQQDTGGHTCPKPLQMCVDMIQTFADGDLVYDPFLGSGSTLIACHQAGRTCYGIEVDPKYCDVIVARYEAHTGQTATREALHDQAAD